MSERPRITPQNETEVCDAVREAAEKGRPLEILARGTKRDFGRPVAAEAILDTSALSGILNYEPEELVITARAGTPLAEIEAALSEKRQTLGFAPADFGPLFAAQAGAATLGGVVATDSSGSRRVKAGAVRDHVIGCRFVNGQGQMIKAGGQVIKNVTGFDIPKLMCGAFGTLGVLAELTLRVTPIPDETAALALPVPDAAAGLEKLRAGAALPVDATGLSFLPQGVAPQDLGEGSGLALIRVEGTSAAVAEKLVLLRTRLAGSHFLTLDSARTSTLFRDIGNGALFAGRSGDIWRLCVPPASAREAVEAAGSSFWYADWAGGLLWLELPATEETAARLREVTARLGGHATLMRGSAAARERLAVFEPEAEARAGLTRAVKAAFDPFRVLNPGRMYKGV